MRQQHSWRAGSVSPLSAHRAIIFLATAWLAVTLVPIAPAADPAPEDKPAKKAEEKIPPAQTHYLGREIATTMHYEGADWLTRENRERQEEGSTLLKVLKIKPGQVVCDMGCGNGYYSLKLAEQVGGKGQVLAVDIQPEMLRLLQARAKAAKVDNIKPILGSLVDPRLPAGGVDLILCVDVYHEFSHPEQMLAAMRNSLKERGQLVLVEFRLEDPEVPIKLLHKMSKKQILKELTPNGFKLVEEFDKLPWQHVMIFERDDAQDGAGKKGQKPAANGEK